MGCTSPDAFVAVDNLAAQHNRSRKSLAPDTGWETITTGRLSVGGAMSNSDSGYDYERYRRLLAEADDEPKRMALIDLLTAEKAKDRLAEHVLRASLAELRVTAKPKP
jgi:hypothetical protein